MRAAQALEQAIRHEDAGAVGDAVIASRLDALSAPLQALLNAISGAGAGVDAGGGESHSEKPSVDVLRPEFEKLAYLLEEDDSQAANTATSLAVLLRGSPVEQAFAAVIEAIRHYDFPTALHLLHRVSEALGIRINAQANAQIDAQIDAVINLESDSVMRRVKAKE
jgi:hypothetical protein